MGYYIDLKTISIEKYKEILKSTELIPSWKILKDNIDENLDKLKKQNLNNLDELMAELKSKEKINMLSDSTDLPVKYLEVLKRVINGYKPKPNRFKDFTLLSKDVIEKLDSLGLKNSLKLYEKILTPELRKEFSQSTGISSDDVLKLTKLTDLSRIRWVNHTFAYVLMESGYETVELVTQADYKKMYRDIKQLNEEREIYNAHIGERDMKMVIESAKTLDLEIEY